MLVSKVIISEAEIESLAAPWRALQAARGLAPFTGFDWIWAWWQSVGKPEGARLVIIACFDGERLAGVLPFAIALKYGARILRFAGHDVFYIRNILAENADVSRALWTKLREIDLYDCAAIKNIHDGTPDAAVLESFALRVERNPVYFRRHEGMTRKAVFTPYTKRFRRKLYKIAEDIAKRKEFTHGVSADAAPLEEALPFLIAEKSAWCEDRHKSGIFDSPHASAFYRAMCEVGLKEESLRLFWLRQNGVLVALLLCFIGGGTLYAHTVAHHPSVRKIHPGLFLKAEAMSWACENGLHETNFMEGAEFFKVRFSSGARGTQDFLYPRTLKGRLFALAYFARQKARRLFSRGGGAA